MNGKARCPSRGVSPSPAGLRGVGPKKQGLPRSLVSPAGTWAGARGPRTAPLPERISPRYPSRPFPHRGGQRGLRSCGRYGRHPGVRGRGGVVTEPGTRLRFLFVPLPARGFGDLGDRARGLA